MIFVHIGIFPDSDNLHFIIFSSMPSFGKFRKYEFRSQIGRRSMKFRLCDSMGLEESQKLDAVNFPYLLDGNINDRFQVSRILNERCLALVAGFPKQSLFNTMALLLQFNPTVPITPDSPGYNSAPKLKDKTHVAVFVVDGSNVSVLSQTMIDKLKALRVLVNQRG